MDRAQWKIGGEAGFGIMTAGLIFSKACTRGGLYAFSYVEYPSLIRGGHNTCQVTVSKDYIGCQTKKVDVLVALNKETISLHREELSSGAAVIYDPDKVNVTPEEAGNVRLVGVPFSKIAIETAGIELVSNNVALGASIAVLDYDINLLLSVISEQFKGKGEDVIKKNIESAKAGYDFVKKNFSDPFAKKLQKTNSQPKLLVTGNEAIGAGAIAAGCKFYAGYPMTPTSNLLHFMASNEGKYGLLVKQAEDEISVINMAIGAAHIGVRSMVATSGGGFCLMSEGYGLAGMTETPVVIAMGMRGGPSTGLPTWTEQSDLKFVLNAAHGEFPRVVIAPGDMGELFAETTKAFNIAEKYQTPVIILYDKHLAESHTSIDSLETSAVKIERGNLVTGPVQGYKRYEINQTGISPRAFPGQLGNLFVANSDEHDERGLSTEDMSMRKAMMEKRMKKIEIISTEVTKPKLHGPKRADITLIGWGSTKGAILDAMSQLKTEGIKANFLQIVTASPFSSETLNEILKTRKPKLIIENNYTGQMSSLIKEHIGIEIKNKLLKYDGRPFYTEEIMAEAKKVLNK